LHHGVIVMSYFVIAANRLSSGQFSRSGNVCDIGFSGDAVFVLSDRPPRPDPIPYDHWCRDRFFSIRAVDRVTGGRHDRSSRTLLRSIVECYGSIGAVEIRECRVDDTYMRGNIDFTGIYIELSLQKAAYKALDAYLSPWVDRRDSSEKRDDELFPREGSDGHDSLETVVLIRIPSRPFAFPMPRGSTSPYLTNSSVSDLKLIKRFAFDEIEFQVLRDVQGQPMTLEEAVREGRPALRPALSLSGTSSLSRTRRMVRHVFGRA